MAATMPGTGGGGPRPVGAGNEEIGQQWLRQAETLRATLQAAKAPVGLSPKEVVWWKNKARLYRYTASAPRTHRVPMLIV